MPRLHHLLAELLQAQSRHSDAAEASLRTPVDIARAQGARGWELRAATGLARLWRDQRKGGKAHDLLAPIYGWFTGGFDTPDLKEAKALLDQLARAADSRCAKSPLASGLNVLLANAGPPRGGVLFAAGRRDDFACHRRRRTLFWREQQRGDKEMTTTAPATALHYAPNANLADGSFNAAGDPGSIGFNLADVSSQSSADALPAGDQGLLWIGSDSIAQAESIVAATANDPKIYGYYVADEPADSAFPTIKTIDQYISAHAAGKVSFIVAENEGSYQSPDITATPANTGADLVGLDPYPIQGQFSGGQDLAIIPAYVQSAEAGGWQQSQIVPVYQAFGGGGYSQWTLPTAVQEDQILATWSTLTPNPAFDSAYSWGTQDNDDALTNTPSLQAVFQQLSEGSGGGSPPPPSPTITFSGPSSEPLAASGDTALLGIGVSSTDASDPMTATLSDANDALIVDGKSHSAGSQITLSGSPTQVDADLDNILASANTGTVVLSATQDGVTQTASISLAAVGAPSMTFSYDVRQNESAPAPAAGSRPVIYDIGSRGTGTLTIADFRKGTDALQFANGVTATSVSVAGSGLEFNLSDHGHVVITALS